MYLLPVEGRLTLRVCSASCELVFGAQQSISYHNSDNNIIFEVSPHGELWAYADKIREACGKAKA